MKKFILCALAAAIFAMPAAEAKDNKSGLSLGSIAGALTGSGSSSDNGSSDILGAVGSFINNVTLNKNFTVDDLVGRWEYTAPAVTFESDNALKKIGGAGAATAVEGKLEPYYRRLGMTKTVLTVDKDHSFSLKMGLMLLKGTIEKEEDGTIMFKFSAFGKVSLGSVQANITKSGDTINLTFEATKMVKIITTVASKVNSASVKTLAELLGSYDGIYIGFKLKLAEK